MRLLVTAFVLLLATGLIVGCAALGPGDGTGGTGGAGSPVITVACMGNILGTTSILDWELMVSAEPIESGQPFSATVDGIAMFGEAFLDAGQTLFLGGVKEVNVVDFNGTVHVRSGATGADVILTVDPTVSQYECERSRTACDPQNDLPSVPGLVGNTDCEGESPLNPCGRFLLLPISSECDPGGTCDELGKTGPGSQCAVNDFCITGDLRVPLQEAAERYTADIQGDVLFGWADESTGAILKEDEPNKGTWILPPAVYAEPTGPLGLRLILGSVPVALECAMGVNCVVGVECDRSLSKPTPNSELISFPIQTEAP